MEKALRKALAVFSALTLGASPCFLFAGEEPRVYETVSQEKPLQSSPQFLVIDDFNTGKFQIRQGAAWRVKAPAVGALDLTIDKTDARSKDHGYSLKAQFNLQPSERVSLETFLDRVDVSRASHFAFRMKASFSQGKGFPGKILISLSDWRHKTIAQDITDYLPQTLDTWADTVLPMSLFESLDRDQLVSLKITITAGSEAIKGSLWLDEVAFYGGGDLEFECHRDNVMGFPTGVADKPRADRLKKEKNEKKFLKEIAVDTWKYFQNARDKDTGLVVDHIRMGDAPLIADYTSPTNIAMDLIGTVAAMDMELIKPEEAKARIAKVFLTLKKAAKYRGFFYNFYDTKKLSIERSYISSVDSGWLAIALVVVRQAFRDEFYKEATAILDQFHFSDFLDPENNQLVVGLDVPVRNFGQYHYGLLVTEARATSLYAIGKGDIPKEHWWYLYRTLPEVWSWQTQKPQGHYVTRDGVEFFQGYYEKDGKKFVPSWGGSLFEYLMPTLVLKERELAGKGLGLNDRIAAELHRDYALKEKGYPVWGISPCAVSNGRKWAYREYGVPALGSKGYSDGAVATPHVSFLALDAIPKDAIKNIRKFLDYGMYGEYGFFDALELKNLKANPQYLALDQGMILVAIANYLEGGSIQKRYHEDEIGKKVKDLLVKESFFNR